MYTYICPNICTYIVRTAFSHQRNWKNEKNKTTALTSSDARMMHAYDFVGTRHNAYTIRTHIIYNNLIILLLLLDRNIILRRMMVSHRSRKRFAAVKWDRTLQRCNQRVGANTANCTYRYDLHNITHTWIQDVFLTCLLVFLLNNKHCMAVRCRVLLFSSAPHCSGS